MKSKETIRNQSGERRVVMTIAIGNVFQDMYDFTVPLIEAYCEKHNLDFYLYGDDKREKDEHPCHMKQRIQELLESYDRVFFVDADCVIMPSAPNIFEFVPRDKLGVFQLKSYSGKPLDESERFKSSYSTFVPYLREYNKLMVQKGLDEIELPDRYNGSAYYSAGVFVCSKETNPHIPPVEGIMRIPTSVHYDQNYFNAMIIKHNIPVFDIGWKWHVWGALVSNHYKAVSSDPLADGFLIHYAGKVGKVCITNQVTRLLEIINGQRVHSVLPKPKHKFHVHFWACNSAQPWILEHMLDAIAQTAPEHIYVTQGTEHVDREGSVVCYFTYRVFNPRKYSKTVTFFTHPEVPAKWKSSAMLSDYCIVMCNQYKDDVISLGAKPENVTVIYPGIHDYLRSKGLKVFNPSKLNYALNRKRADLWEKVTKIPGVQAVCSEGLMTPEEIADWYDRCDVVFSSAWLEGGPMSVLEGLAAGKKVIARAGCGLVDDFKDHVIRYSTDEEALEILAQLADEKQKRISSVSEISWESWGTEFWKVLEHAYDCSGQTYKEDLSETKTLRRMVPNNYISIGMRNAANAARKDQSTGFADPVRQALRGGTSKRGVAKSGLRAVGNGATGTRRVRGGNLKEERQLRQRDRTSGINAGGYVL